MTRYLIGTIAAAGHINPALPIARKLVEHSHEVWWYTGSGFKEKIEATGAHHVPIRTGIDFTDINTIPKSWLDQKDALKGVIHVTQGTVATEVGDLIVPTIKALANEDVLSRSALINHSWYVVAL